MDFWINPDNLTRIFWLGGLWVLLSVIWASASVWIASDSELIFGESSWPLASVCFGAVFFLVTVMWGLSATPVFAVGFIAALFFYTFTRDKKAPAQERILCVAFLKKVLRRSLIYIYGKEGAAECSSKYAVSAFSMQFFH